MSTMFSGDCTEDSNSHGLGERQSILDLQRNSKTGCRICQLLFNAIQSFYGLLIEQHAAEIDFSCMRTAADSLLVHLLLDRCKNIIDQYWSKGIGTLQIMYEDADRRFESYAKKGHLGGVYSPLEILPGRRPPDYPDQNMKLIHHWIQECVGKHPSCQVDTQQQLPKRIIDVGKMPGTSVHLCETVNHQIRYAALSHRWGASSMVTTTKDNLEARKDGIECSTLSKTFQDAIILTRLLDLRYLWIDALCILQDDTADWEIESSKMASIYENSYVTISVNSSSGALLGDLSLRQTRSAQIEVMASNGKAITFHVRPIKEFEHEAFSSSSLEGMGKSFDTENFPLFGRAWCFQERLLATRVLHFTDAEVVFECKTSCYCECGGIEHWHTTPLKQFYGQVIQNTSVPEIPVEPGWDGWTQVVRLYILRDLTVPEDVLPALAGIASRMQSSKLGRYIAGLWEARLATDLFWFAQVLSNREPFAQTAPTFSWAALAGASRVMELQWPYGLGYDNCEQMFKILDVQLSICTLNPYGRVSDATVKISGYGVSITLKAGQVPLPFNATLRSKTREMAVMAFMDRFPTSVMDTERAFVCFLGFKWTETSANGAFGEHIVSALLLKPLGAMGRYERFGSLPFLGNDQSWFEEAEEMSFTIV